MDASESLQKEDKQQGKVYFRKAKVYNVWQIDETAIVGEKQNGFK